MSKYRIVKNKYGYYRVQMKILGLFWFTLNRLNMRTYDEAKQVMHYHIEDDKRYHNSWKEVEDGNS